MTIDRLADRGQTRSLMGERLYPWHALSQPAGCSARGTRGLLLAALAALAAGCPPEGGRILGDTPNVSQAQNTCQLECDEASDCPPTDTTQWRCEDGLCLAVLCLDDDECLGDTRCRQGHCADPCIPEGEPLFAFGPDCAEADGCCADLRDACVDGYCERQPEVSHPRCEVDADCADLCADFDPDEFTCSCLENGLCVRQPTLGAFECEDPCGGTDTSSAYDGDNFACMDNVCTWLGCNDDDECLASDALFPGIAHTGCDEDTGFCTSACDDDRDCVDLASYARLRSTFNVSGEGVPLWCLEGSCVYVDSCTDDGDCVLDREGYCVLPSTRSNGYCVYGDPICFSDADCYEWESCRENHCRYYTTDYQPYAVGRSCQDDAACEGKYLMQSMLLTGDWPSYPGEQRACSDYCPELFGCPNGTTCVNLPRGSALDGLQSQRSACVPEPCTSAGGCPASFATCADDSECPDSERCAWPTSHCPGVCMALDCTECHAWIEANQKHTCYGGDIQIDLSIIRPD